MDAPSLEPYNDAQIDRFPLLMERLQSHDGHEEFIDFTRVYDASSSSSRDGRRRIESVQQDESRISGSTEAAAHQTTLSTAISTNSRNSWPMRRGGGGGYGRHHRSPLNSRLWISVELIVTVSQIIASVVVLSLSRHENPQAPLFAWVVGYASGCVATLPVLYRRYCNRIRGAEHDSSQSRTSQGNPSSEPRPYTAIFVARASEENNHTRGRSLMNSLARSLSARVWVVIHRLNGLMDHLKIALDCFFAVWFVVGNVWIFGRHTSPSNAPKLYRLCIVFLTFSCIGYAMPFILCATICCCLPCIISFLGFQEEFYQTKGATPEIINTLPIYKYKLKKDGNGDQERNLGESEGGLLAAGTEKERAISGEDAVCCICLAKYADNDELRELPCIHLFHVDCVDEWLKINALCPLCKNEVGDSTAASLSATDSSRQQNERRVGVGPAEGAIYGGAVF